MVKKAYTKPRLTRVPKPDIINLGNGWKPWGSFPCHPVHGPGHHHRPGRWSWRNLFGVQGKGQ